MLVCSWMLITNIVKAQTSKTNLNQKISVEALKEDFKTLRKNLETAHPGLYTYTSKRNMDRAFNAVEASINQPMTSIEFFRKLAPLNQYIRNGHTYFNPSATYINAARNDFLFFPFETYWHKGNLYIAKNLSMNPAIKEGSIIEKINGEKASEVFKELASYVPRDGYNLTKPQNEANKFFRHYFAYYKGTPSSFQLTISSAAGTNYNIEVKALSNQQVKKNRLSRYGKSEKKKPVLSLSIHNKVATLTIKSFLDATLKNGGQKYRRFFKRAFTKITSSGAKYLILDLRGNLGGNPEVAIELLSYLQDKPFIFYKDVVTITQKLPNKKLYKTKVTLNRLKKDGDIFHYKYIGLKKRQPSRAGFKASVFVLTDGFSFSVTGFLAGFLKSHHKKVTFIGEEPGGNANTCVAGIKPTLVLPKTKVRITVPLMLFEMNVNHQNQGHGVTPDYAIKPTIKDVLAKKDPAMELVNKLIIDHQKE